MRIVWQHWFAKAVAIRLCFSLIVGSVIISPLILASCEKKHSLIDEPEDETTQPPDKETEGNNQDDDTTSTHPSDEDFVIVGKGDGSALVIDGSNRDYACRTTIKIKGGTYSTITAKNLQGQAGCPIKITNQGTVTLVGNGSGLRLSNIRHTRIQGNGTPGVSRGFVFRNMNTEAVQLDGAVNDFAFSHASFTNVNAYGVIRYKPTLVYNGSDDSYIKNLSFTHIDCDGSGTLIRFEGSEGNGNITGLIRAIEIAHIHFKNAPQVGSVVVLEKAEDFDIHNNVVEQINSENSNHNGVFYIQGNGKFYNNLIRDHQGNAIRAWVYSIGSTPKDMLIYNNIVVNSREYGAFELQSFDRDIVSGKSTYANAKVFNNTCGNLRPKAGSFPAQIVDLYSLKGGTCEIFNNVGYSFYRVGQNNTNYFWNELGDTKPSKASNNQYFDNYQKAGIIDEAKFLLDSSSPLKGAAEPFALLKEDIYGKARGSKPSIGAVE